MVVLRGFLTGDRLERVLASIREATWEPHQDEIADELIMVDNSASALLHFLMHDPELFALIREITGCSEIGRFGGRIYRMYPDTGHHADWHRDLAGGRLVAMSINLSEEPFECGGLEMRDWNTKVLYSEAPRLQLGDAVVLRLRRDLEHCVNEVTGRHPKTAFAGFFFADETSVLTRPRTTLRKKEPV